MSWSKKISVYNDSRIAIIDELQSLNIEQAVKVEAYIILLCVKGKGSLYINGESRMIHVNDLFICHPNIILENSMISIDFECRCICLSSEYMKQLLLIAGESWDLKMFIEKIPILFTECRRGRVVFANTIPCCVLKCWALPANIKRN